MFVLISILCSILQLLDQPLVHINVGDEATLSRSVSVSSSQSNRRMTLTPTDTAIIGKLHFQISTIEYHEKDDDRQSLVHDLTSSPPAIDLTVSPRAVHPLLKDRQPLDDLRAPGPEFTAWEILTS